MPFLWWMLFSNVVWSNEGFFPSNHPAVIEWNHCTASHISNTGLILTNYHCITVQILEAQQMQPQILENGFLASKIQEEIPVSDPRNPQKQAHLVYVPPLHLAMNGGAASNWQWPRASADIAILRIEANPQYLHLSRDGWKANDPITVIGYPQQTFRNAPLSLWDYWIDIHLAWHIQTEQNAIDWMQSHQNQIPQNQLLYYQSWLGNLQNYLTYHEQLSKQLSGQRSTWLLQNPQKSSLSIEELQEAYPMQYAYDRVQLIKMLHPIFQQNLSCDTMSFIDQQLLQYQLESMQNWSQIPSNDDQSCQSIKRLLAENIPKPSYQFQPQQYLNANADQRRSQGQILNQKPTTLSHVEFAQGWVIAQDIPVNFLSNVDVSAGHSGAPTLNRKGEIIGVVFDMTKESILSDWMYLPSHQTIHMDVGYLYWLLEQTPESKMLLQEILAPQELSK